MIRGFFRLIFYVFVAYIIYLVLRIFTGSDKRKQKSFNRGQHHSGIMVKDEVCNTYLPREDAIREVIKGEEHFFCSNDCRQKFLEAKKEAS